MHLERQLLTVERARLHDGLLVHIQLAEDIGEDVARGGASQGHDRRRTPLEGAVFPRQARDVEVSGAEVVSPLADAMRLVDDAERDGQIGGEAAQPLPEGWYLQPLGGDEDEQVVALFDSPAGCLEIS